MMRKKLEIRYEIKYEIRYKTYQPLPDKAIECSGIEVENRWDLNLNVMKKREGAVTRIRGRIILLIF